MRRSLPLIVLLALAAIPASAHAAAFAPIGDQVRLSKMGTDGDDTGFVSGKALGYDERDDRYLAVFNGRDVSPEKRSLFAQPIDAAGAPIGPRKLIADKGPDGTTPFEVLDAAVVWNPDAGEFLAVWAGRPLAGDGRDIFARRISPDGDVLGTVPTRVSFTGPVAVDSNREARGPSVAYNRTDHEYLVVWAADDLNDGHLEIFGQRLNGTDGLQVGANDFPISQTGTTATEPTDNARPEAAYDSHDNEYLVAWRGQVTTAGDGHAIRAQHLTAAGGETGTDDFGVSNPRSSADALIDSVDLAYNPDDDDFLVVYDEAPIGVEREIRTRHIGQAGAPVGDEQQVSDNGPDGNDAFDPFDPEVTYDPVRHGYVAVWDSDDTTDEHYEIYAQQLTPVGADVGPNDVRVSFTGATTNPDAAADEPAVAFASRHDQYLVIWDANPGTGGLAANEVELFGSRLGELPDPPAGGGAPAAAPPPPPPPPQQQQASPGADAVPPGVKLSGRRSQRVLRQNGLKVTAATDEDALFTASALIAIPGRAARSVRLTGARTRTRTRKATLAMKLPRRQRALLAKALKRRRSLKATITVRATDAAGLSRTKRLAVRVIR